MRPQPVAAIGAVSNTRSCCLVRVDGAGVPARRFAVSVESGRERRAGRGGRVQRPWEGHPDRASRCEDIPGSRFEDEEGQGGFRVCFPLLQVHCRSVANGTVYRSDEASHMLLTKGDNNIADDTELYARGQDYLNYKEDIVGSVRGYIPMVGYVTIMLSEHPWLKSVLLGIMGLMVILQREQ